jgi:hypothetical protein
MELHEAKQNSRDKIARLLAYIDKKTKADMECGERNWGLAGNLNHVAEELKNIAEFYGYRDEA